MSMFTTLSTALATLIPNTWTLVEFEQTESTPPPDVTTVELKLRTVRRLPAAPRGNYEVEWVVTITSPYTSRETADPQLYDDLIAFLLDLDTTEGLTWLGWTEATKTVGADLDRLAYDITVTTHAKKDEA